MPHKKWKIELKKLPNNQGNKLDNLTYIFLQSLYFFNI